ncbi:hypothetical protein ACG2LH_15990 [Zhouia sp. PK063]|uniref:hypothetical protein n=1 Tax=Zhouia sp. PK063 TaxID=3373602 RepID=UPI0037A755CF
MIGRIERASHIAGWDKILLLTQHLDINFIELWELKSEQELISLIDEVYKLDKKLNNTKELYYTKLKQKVQKMFRDL